MCSLWSIALQSVEYKSFKSCKTSEFDVMSCNDNGVHQVEQSATELQTFSQLKKQEDTAIPRRQEVNSMMQNSLGT